MEKEMKSQEMKEKKIKKQEIKAMLQKLKTEKNLKEIKPDIPVNQQMTLEEYREQVFLWMKIKGGYCLPVIKQLMNVYWDDFQEYYEGDWDIVTVGFGMFIHYL